MLPELLRVHLTLAVLKLYEFGVEDVLEFEFVEQPDSSNLREAMKYSSLMMQLVTLD